MRLTGKAEKLIEYGLLSSAWSSILAVGLITVFVFAEGSPVFRARGIIPVTFGTTWEPMAGVYGLLPMILGSVLVTTAAAVIGVPLGLACAVFFAEIAPRKLSEAMSPAVDILAGIPSVVYGFFGIVVIMPLVRDYLGGFGFSTLTAAIVLSIMILPTIVNVSRDAIDAVPNEYREGSYALGATKWQTIRRAVLPAARSGITAAVVLGMGRAIGETMAVIMVAGNAPAMPGAGIPASLVKPVQILLAPVRTLTGNIAVEMSYASGEHQKALFSSAAVLFVLIIALNVTAQYLTGRESRR